MGLATVSRALSPALSTCIRCGTEFIFKLKSPDHELHQVLPTCKDHIACKCSDIIKKGLPSGKRLAKQRILLIPPRQDGMEQKRQQIETEQKRRQVSLAVAKVMLDMIALGLEHVVVFVFDFPSPTASSGKVGNVVIRYLLPPVKNLTKITALKIVQGAFWTQWCVDAWSGKKATGNHWGRF